MKHRRAARPLCVGVLGGTRVNKLSDKIASAIVLLLSSSKGHSVPIECLFHTFGQRQQEVDEILVNVDQSKLKIRHEALNEQAYFQDLASCDVLLLYYRPEAYHSTTSGIFLEAGYAAKHVIVAKGTWQQLNASIMILARF